MQLTALGHAGLLVASGRGRILIDPWFAPDGAFQGSWFPFPDNSHLLSQLGTTLTCPDAVVLSHEHLDHLDPWFLGRLDPQVPVVIPHYPSAVLRDKVEAARRGPVHEVAAEEEREVAPGIVVWFVRERSPMNHDAAVIVRADDSVLVDLNDARLTTAQLHDVRERVDAPIDALLIQGAGASWYPIRYDYPIDQQRRLSREKRLAKFAYCEAAARAADPAVVLPAAGPPCFLDDDLFDANREMDGGIFPDQLAVSAWLRKRISNDVAVLLPGDGWDTATRRREPDPVWEGVDLADRGRYLHDYADRRRQPIVAVHAAHPEPGAPLDDAVRAHFEGLLALSPYFNGRIDMPVAFDISGPHGGRWVVDFRPGREGVVAAAAAAANVEYRMEGRWLLPVLRNEVPWEDFFLSLRFSVHRDPDIHSDHLLGLLKFADAGALAAVEAFERGRGRDDRITVTCDGVDYEIERFCPHAGSDLATMAEVLPGGRIRCLAHYYEFDLASGECQNGACEPLLTSGPRTSNRGAATRTR